jgi:hypothetical protein
MLAAFGEAMEEAFREGMYEVLGTPRLDDVLRLRVNHADQGEAVARLVPEEWRGELGLVIRCR